MKLHAAFCSFLVASQGLSAVTATDESSSIPTLLEQYTPDRAEWSTFQTKAVDNNPTNTDHSPDGIGWIDRDDWISWDGIVINPTEYTRSELAQKICPGSTVLGIRDVFYATNPFADVTRPTKAEVDYWHTIAVNHIRALVGYTEPEYIIEPDKCLHLRALWSDERFRTRMWDTEDYPGTCLGSTNPHCGAGFIPSVEDQQPYLPEGIASCGSRAGSEGMFSAAKSNIPWSMKWARPFCTTLGSEGFWGGHTGPWFHRSEFGWSWWDGDEDNMNSNAGLRTKWSGPSGAVKYEDPDITNGRFKVLVEGVNPDHRFTTQQCETAMWIGGADTATDCYWDVMNNDTCGKRFMTYNSNTGCACYPTDMSFCKIQNSAGRLTWDFEPIQSSFDGLLIDTTKALSSTQLPYSGRRCPDIIWKTVAGDASHCLQIIMTGEGGIDVSDCGRKFITWNTANGGCACYPESRETCTREETIRESGRTTYELEVDPTWSPPTDPSPSEAPSQGPSEGPSFSSSEAPSQSPNAEDDVKCIEKKKDRYFGGIKNGKERTPTCASLGKKNNKKRREFCKMTESATDGTKSAKDACPVTCKMCDCGEVVEKRFFLQVDAEGELEYKTCLWLKKYFKNKPKQAQQVCDMETPDFDTKFQIASEVCPVTCNSCPA